MCVEWTSAWHESTEPITAYKMVMVNEDGSLRSYYDPERRVKQIVDLEEIYEKPGKIKTYKLGKRHKSSVPKTPGIYLYESSIPAESLLNPRVGNALIEVIIPKGTIVRYGQDRGWKAICAEVIKVDRIVGQYIKDTDGFSRWTQWTSPSK